MVAGRPNQSPHVSPCVLLRYLCFFRGRCGDSHVLFPFCLFSSLFAEFGFLLITLAFSTSISGAKKHINDKETEFIYPFNVSLSSVRATTNLQISFNFNRSEGDVQIDKVWMRQIWHLCGCFTPVVGLTSRLWSLWWGDMGPSLELVFPITRDKHAGVMMLALNSSEIPSQYISKIGRWVACSTWFQNRAHLIDSDF